MRPCASIATSRFHISKRKTIQSSIWKTILTISSHVSVEQIAHEKYVFPPATRKKRNKTQKNERIERTLQFRHSTNKTKIWSPCVVRKIIIIFQHSVRQVLPKHIVFICEKFLFAISNQLLLNF